MMNSNISKVEEMLIKIASIILTLLVLIGLICHEGMRVVVLIRNAYSEIATIDDKKPRSLPNPTAAEPTRSTVQ